MARFLVAPEVFAMFPGAVLGVIVARGVDNAGEPPGVEAGLRQEEARVRELFAGQPVTEHPRIAVWREAYRKFGAKPKDHPSSIENLVRRVAKGHALPRTRWSISTTRSRCATCCPPAARTSIAPRATSGSP